LLEPDGIVSILSKNLSSSLLAGTVILLMTVSGAQAANVRIIPQPKRLRLAPGDPGFRLRPRLTWSVTGPAGETRVRDAVRAWLRGELGLRPVPAVLYPSPGTWTVIRLGAARPGARPVEEGAPAPHWYRSPEGYRVTADERGIEIAASTPAGAFYGLQSLAQAVRKDERGWLCPALQVEDWPTLGFRGAHFFPSASGVPFHRKLITRVLARYKLNHAVIQCEAARWSSHPEIAAPNSISKAELRKLVALCRANFIEPVPLVNCPGHGQWMFRNGKNLRLAEDPQTPYAYCVSNAASDQFIREILTEALEVFHPRYFHLGHDEVTLRGRFPNPDCPRCRGRTTTDLVLAHARRLSAWLAERNVRPIFWGDMLFAKGETADGSAHAPNEAEAQARRSGLPRSAIVADWHYGRGARYPSLDLLRQEGLTTLAVTWDKPLNVYHFSLAAQRAGALGLLQSTWCGYFPDESVLKSSLPQFSAFLLAGDYAWSGRSEKPSALPYVPDAEFTRAYYRQP
jgi:hypothetical protein